MNRLGPDVPPRVPPPARLPPDGGLRSPRLWTSFLVSGETHWSQDGETQGGWTTIGTVGWYGWGVPWFLQSYRISPPQNQRKTHVVYQEDGRRGL